jgi:hypothetical protein
VVSPDPLSPLSATLSVKTPDPLCPGPLQSLVETEETPVNTEGDPDAPVPAVEGDMQM